NRVIVWSGKSTLERLEEKPWLQKIYNPLLDRSFLHRLFWQWFELHKSAQEEECDLLFVPGGLYFGRFRPFAAMSQNMLPFEWQESRRFGLSPLTLKFLMLHGGQKRTLKRAQGVLFLTEYAR